MVQNPPGGGQRIVPRLCYRDVRTAVGWLDRAFGLREREQARVEADDGNIQLTEIEYEQSRLMLSSPGSHDLSSPADGGAGQMVILYVDGVDAHHERAVAAGARIVMPLADQFWGDRRYECYDHEGHRWGFYEHIRDVSREEMAEAMRKLKA